MRYKKQIGSLEIICGSMFSGKSEELIKRVRRAEFAKQKVSAFKPLIDIRYQSGSICSHDGVSLSAQAISSAKNIYDKLPQDTEVIAIDEIQFFDTHIIEIVTELINYGYRIICAGLDLDFRAVPFGPMPLLMALAESVTKLQAVCQECGKPAWCSQRLINGKPAPYDSSIIMIGAHESYEARCREHHYVPNKPENSFLAVQGVNFT